jgi:hypothetical protein
VGARWDLVLRPLRTKAEEILLVEYITIGMLGQQSCTERLSKTALANSALQGSNKERTITEAARKNSYFESNSIQ